MMTTKTASTTTKALVVATIVVAAIVCSSNSSSTNELLRRPTLRADDGDARTTTTSPPPQRRLGASIHLNHRDMQEEDATLEYALMFTEAIVRPLYQTPPREEEYYAYVTSSAYVVTGSNNDVPELDEPDTPTEQEPSPSPTTAPIEPELDEPDTTPEEEPSPPTPSVPVEPELDTPATPTDESTPLLAVPVEPQVPQGPLSSFPIAFELDSLDILALEASDCGTGGCAFGSMADVTMGTSTKETAPTEPDSSDSSSGDAASPLPLSWTYLPSAEALGNVKPRQVGNTSGAAIIVTANTETTYPGILAMFLQP